MEDKCVCCGAVIPEGRQVCPNCEANRLDRDIVSAIRAGMSYGKWKAMQNPVTITPVQAIPEGWLVCVWCGKPYKPKTKRKQLFCEANCQQEEYRARAREKKAERMKALREKQKEEQSQQ